jgi:hypothetical protein
LDILAILSRSPNLALLLTLRGILPGPHRISWSQPELSPLSPLSIDAARDLYVNIHPEAKEDERLDELLDELGGMPLAVRLISERGRSGDTPSEILELWREAGPDLVDGPRADRRTGVNKSIELSLQSGLVRDTRCSQAALCTGIPAERSSVGAHQVTRSKYFGFNSLESTNGSSSDISHLFKSRQIRIFRAAPHTLIYDTSSQAYIRAME